MLRWICGNTRQDSTRLLANMARTRLRWSEHIEKRHVYSLGRRVDQMESSQITGGSRRPRKTILETINKNLEI